MHRMRTFLVITLSLVTAWWLVANPSLAADGPWSDLKMAGEAGENWAFVGGDWGQGADGVIGPPPNYVDQNLALATKHAYGDFEAEFEFRWNNLCCGGGFVFRARDARHYYLIEFPCTGQQYRAEYFWVCISKVDDSGWAKVLRTEIVHGVPSEIGMWHRCRLVVRGDEIRLWVDDRPFPVVCDDTYSESGYVGLESYDGLGGHSPCSFRSVRIRGQVRFADSRNGAAQGSPWNASIQPVQNWFYPTLEDTYGVVHHLSSITRTPNGDLLMKLSAGSEFHGQQWTPVLIRSSDNGRTWSAQQKIDDRLLHGMLHTTRDGRLLMMEMKSERPFSIRMTTSEDNGMTWQCCRFDTTSWANGFTYEIEPDVVMYASTAKYSDPHVRVHLFHLTPEGPEPIVED